MKSENIESPTLHTERLLLRPFVENDAEQVFICCQNPNLGNNAGWKPHETFEESKEILQTVFIGQENIWAIILKEKQQLIGSIGIVPDPKRENPQARMLGYWLDELHWGHGYMTEAVQTVLEYSFTKIKISLITANCYPHNERSQNVLQKNGFIYEGILHQAELIYNGQIYDHQCYYLLAR
ncbi:MAG: GNAT family protein [Bacteroides sp.]|nr:GNAT family protein [Bacteroides sp.]MDD3036658.1 GNAT family protein [Bacteroides sp.]